MIHTSIASLPRIERLIQAARDRIPVFQAKINHGFWETWHAIEKLRNLHPEMTPANLDRATRRHFMVESGFLEEVEDLLKAWPEPPDGPYLSCSADAFPGEDRLAPLPPTPREKIEGILSRKAPHFSLNSDGMIWKQAVLDGSLEEFLRAIGEQRVIVVGPTHLQAHEEIWHWRDAHFEQIHPTCARKDRYEILQRLEEALASCNFSTVLLQCGSLSAWLVYKLYRCDANYSVYDLGRALDFIDPDKVLKQPWGAAHAQTLAWHYGKQIKQWQDWIERELVGFPDGPLQVRTARPGPIEFVERKRVNFSSLKKQLSKSEDSGHWANFGPAVQAFEQEIQIRQGLDDSTIPITTSSGTAALWVAAGVATLQRGEPIRWAVSSFGFFSSKLGPLTPAVVLDCDASGMLSIAELEKLSDTEYDGIIVTDLFGRSDLQPYIEFSRKHNKQLIIDAAGGWGREIYRSLDIPTAFSFHHTKPFGFGEGGCLFVPRALAQSARSITNYGHGLPDYLKPYCGNWKLSDAQAALINLRHASAAFWSPRHRLQYLRVRQIAGDLEIKLLESTAPMFNSQTVSPPASIALLMDSVIRHEVLADTQLPFIARKYYRPLKNTTQARSLYNRIVCVPTHSDIALLDNATLRNGIEILLSIQERG